MPYLIIALVFVGFLVWAGGRETRWGGLGLLWRVAAWTMGILIVGSLILGLYFWNQDVKKQQQTKLDQAITKTQDEFVGAHIKTEYPNSVYSKYSDEEVGSRARARRPDIYKEMLDLYYKEVLSPAGAASR